ncbi:MAG: hypothetical protein O7G85_00310 [Planctomycetota bacterium]|nr:hypothetical protein [Planctomycetota bacterium]
MNPKSKDNPPDKRSWPCPGCDYDLHSHATRGVDPITCPECGSSVSLATLKQDPTRHRVIWYLVLGTLPLPSSLILLEVLELGMGREAISLFFFFPLMALVAAPVLWFGVGWEWAMEVHGLFRFAAGFLTMVVGVTINSAIAKSFLFFLIF